MAKLETNSENIFYTPKDDSSPVSFLRKKGAVKSDEMEMALSPQPKQRQEITWPCGIKYPGQAKQLINAPNRYLYWCLDASKYPESVETFQRFQSKADQMVKSSKGSQGIKHGPYWGTDNNGRQCFFPARVKLCGAEHNNQAVTLDIEKAPDGSILYITRGFEMKCHK